ncbi:MAG: ISNCY family transposase [Chloroflexota bacterium]
MQEHKPTSGIEEDKRTRVLNTLLAGDMSAAEAATVLGLSMRQVWRLKARYGQDGRASLAHGNRGRRPSHSTSAAIRAQVVTFATGKYAGFNHQYLTEKLAEEGLHLSRSSVRRILLGEGVLTPRPRRAPRHRSRRERLSQEGMLLQADGSRHQWLGPDGPYLTLIAGIDDATGTVPAAVFREQEDAQGYMEWLQAVVLTKGIPLALYVDRHGIFAQNPKRRRSLGEQLSGVLLPTQFGRVLQELQIVLIQARSPQAKGRIERVWGTFQDRLTSELRLAKATTLGDAQRVVTTFLPGFNERFAVPATTPGSAYRPVPERFVPEEVFCFKYRRTVAADNTVSFAAHQLQLQPGPERLSYARLRVDLQERLDGSLAVYSQGRQLAYQPAPAVAPRLRARNIPRPTRAALTGPATPIPPQQVLPATGVPPMVRHSPEHDHPWRRTPIGRGQQDPPPPAEIAQAIADLSDKFDEPRASRRASLTRAATLLTRSMRAPAAFLAALHVAEEKTLRAQAAGRIRTTQVDGRPKLMAYFFAVLENDLDRPAQPAALLELRPNQDTRPPVLPPPTPPAPVSPFPAWVLQLAESHGVDPSLLPELTDQTSTDKISEHQDRD